MKQSIKSIFNNLSLFLIFATIFAGFGVLISIDHSSSYDKIDNLNNQKKIISTLTKLHRDDIELALIQFNGKSTQLLNDIDKLRALYRYNFTEQYIIGNSKEYLADLDELTRLTNDFNTNARNYYIKDTKKDIKRELDLKQSFNTLYNQINTITLKSIQYNKAKFNIHKNVTYLAFVIILLTSLIYRRKLNNIYQDLYFLYNSDNKEYKIYTEEADAIALRMNKKSQTAHNLTMIDPVTSINNHKGMINSYSQKKNMKESDFTSVTVIEIDNFSKSNHAYTQEFTNHILKKVAFTISLHEQSADVIARIDYSQFAIILSRRTKEMSFKDVDIIRQSIAEIKFKSTTTGSVVVTVSGGYVIKPNNTTLDESMKDAKKVLEHAKSHGGDKISQIRDLQVSECEEE